MILRRGMNDILNKYFDTDSPIKVEISVDGGSVYDFCCFGVDYSGKLTDERYMIFYNQTESPKKEICYIGRNNKAEFTLELSKLPVSVRRLVFTVSIDGRGTMEEIRTHSLLIKQNSKAAVQFSLTGADFKKETAIISVEIYRKDGWQVSAIGRGFFGGLADLMRSFGGEEQKPVSTEQYKSKPPAEFKQPAFKSGGRSPAVCPVCGKTIEVDPSNEAEVCKFCGNPFIVEKAINIFNFNQNSQNTIINVYDSKPSATSTKKLE